MNSEIDKNEKELQFFIRNYAKRLDINIFKTIFCLKKLLNTLIYETINFVWLPKKIDELGTWQKLQNKFF